MKYEYIGFMHKVKRTYTVCFPDFEGLLCAGHNPPDAKNNAKEGLIFHIEGMLREGEGIPIPSSMASIKKKFEIDNNLIFFNVEVDIALFNE